MALSMQGVHKPLELKRTHWTLKAPQSEPIFFGGFPCDAAFSYDPGRWDVMFNLLISVARGLGRLHISS